jgi:hypothetical protein
MRARCTPIEYPRRDGTRSSVADVRTPARHQTNNHYGVSHDLNSANTASRTGPRPVRDATAGGGAKQPPGQGDRYRRDPVAPGPARRRARDRTREPCSPSTASISSVRADFPGLRGHEGARVPPGRSSPQDASLVNGQETGAGCCAHLLFRRLGHGAAASFDASGSGAVDVSAVPADSMASAVSRAVR